MIDLDAADSPLEQLVWRISGGDPDGIFAIHPDEGIVTVANAAALAASTQASWDLRIAVQDSGYGDRYPRRDVKFTRHNVFERDGEKCQYCGHTFEREALNLDHVIPRHYGGKTTWENIVCSCIKCNSRKANRLPHDAHMRLIRKPVRPKWRPVISLVLGHQRQPEAWKDFLDVAYWNVELED